MRTQTCATNPMIHAICLLLLAGTFAAAAETSSTAPQPKQLCTSCGDLKITVTKGANSNAQNKAISGVNIVDFMFPATVNVTVGDTVTWTNAGNALHTVTSNTAGLFDSNNLSHNQTFSFVFSSAGTVNYHCKNHGSMTGAIVVSAPSTNANLASLSVSGANLNPAFATEITIYAASVPNSTVSVTVTPATADPNATVKVNGTTVVSGNPSGLIALSVGSGNVISTVVTAQDGSTTMTYKVTITRAASSNADLSSLVLNSATLNQTFSPALLTYTASVPYATSSLTVTPASADAAASISINGTGVTSGTASGSIALKGGSNTIIQTVVTAQDGMSSKTYMVTVTRAAPATNANLSKLAISAGTLTPVFSSAAFNYTASVGNATASITVTPTTADATATVTVNTLPVASGSASGPITLSIGSNPITTVVTAQDGVTALTYNLMLTRVPLTNNADLSNLVPSAGTLTPVFSAATIGYASNVPFNTASITLIPTTADIGATLTVNGTAVVSGAFSAPIPLTVGNNAIPTIVTSSDNSTMKTYTLTVTRAAPASNADLKSVALSSGTLSPPFAAATLSYTSSVINGTTSLTVTPTAADAGASIKVNGSATVSGNLSNAIALSVGSNAVAIVVTAQDGAMTKTYMLSVTRDLTVPGNPGSIIFTSAPSAAPNPVTVGQTVTFSASAASTSALTYTWSYGDGASDAGANATHAFSPAKTYPVTLVVTSVEGGSLSGVISVVVNPLKSGDPGSGIGTLPGEIDSDGDGYSDVVELAAGSDPFDPKSTPATLAGTGTGPVQASASKTTLKISKKQQLTLSGSLHIPKNFAYSGKTLVADVAGFTQKFTLDPKASGKTGKDTFKLGIKSKKGGVGEQDAKFKLVLNAVPSTLTPTSPLLLVIGGTVFTK